MKRLLQYTSHKNNHTSFRSLTPRSRAHFTSSLLSLFIFFYSARITSYYVLLATLARSPLLVSASWHERFSHAYASLACMYTLHACSASCFHYHTCFPTVLVQLISCFVAPCTYFISYVTLYSVPVQRTSRQSSLCRGLATSAQHPLPVMLAMHLHYNSLVQDTRVNLRRTPES